MLYSVIDIGSNTVKCQVYDVDGNSIRRHKFFTRQLGIIAKIENGILADCYIDELTDTINEYISKVESKVYCFATESLRRIDNLEAVREALQSKCALELELISGKDEAILSFEGLMSDDCHIHDGLMVDMGGGSTEFIKFTDDKICELNSFRFGCLSLRRDYVKNRFPDTEELALIRSRVKEELKEYPWIRDCDRLCLIGGTGSAIYKIASELGYTSLPELSYEDFMKLFDYLSLPGKEQIALFEKYIAARAETIIPGMCAYRQIIETVNAKGVYISLRGIRDGYIQRKLRG
ncbi:MAG: hypothetical protein IKT46_05395 [Clostridia bacterium]|nr:hypothetical protein [Clostridia bacterium]